MNTDFLNIRKRTEIANPVKFSGISDRWQKIFREVPVEFQCKASIERTYDILKTSEGGK